MFKKENKQHKIVRSLLFYMREIALEYLRLQQITISSCCTYFQYFYKCYTLELYDPRLI